jgi:hypothetical protein
MKRQIRQGVFETNSSSIHTITIFNGDGYKEEMAKYQNCDYMKVFFGCDQFGWEEDYYVNSATYLWTALVTSCRYSEEELVKFEIEAENILNKYGIKCEFAPWVTKHYSDGTPYIEFTDGYCYIDHSFELVELFDYIFNIDGSINEEHLLRYLFGSVVKTGNDNCDYGYQLIEEAKSTNDAYVIIKGN